MSQGPLPVAHRVGPVIGYVPRGLDHMLYFVGVEGLRYDVKASEIEHLRPKPVVGKS